MPSSRPSALSLMFALSLGSMTLGMTLGLATAGRPAAILAQTGVASDAPASPDQDPAEPPNPLAAARTVFLPAVGPSDGTTACKSSITVQNMGNDPSKAVIITWEATPSACPPQCQGPDKVECSGLMMPGGTWVFDGRMIPTGTHTAVVLSFTARQLSEVGIDLGFDDVVADLMCEELFFGVVGDCDDYRRFMLAYALGKEFRSIPQVKAYGAPIAVEVTRDCPNPADAALAGRSTYAGVNGHNLGSPDPVAGGFRYDAPATRVDGPGDRTVVRIQNAAPECAEVEVWFQAPWACDVPNRKRCAIMTLPPGEGLAVDIGACAAGVDKAGAISIRSTQPVAAVVDVGAGDALMSYAALPWHTVDAATGRPLVSADSTTAFAPLIYRDYAGWNSRIHVANIGQAGQAEAKITFLDRSGDVITTLVQTICAGGSVVFDTAAMVDLPANWVGSARVESLPAPQSGLAAPEIRAVAELTRRTASAAISEGVMAPLIGESAGIDMPNGGGGGLDGGVGLIAIPMLMKDAATSTDLAIQNLVTRPGFTDYAMFIYDQNGLLDFVCAKLQARQTEYINLATWGFVNTGFVGSAVISAVFWEHDVFSPSGGHVRNLVGLGAVAVTRPISRPAGPAGPAVDGDKPGDASTGGIGIPFYPVDGADVTTARRFPGGLCGRAQPPRETPTPTSNHTPTPLPTRPATDTPEPTISPTAGPSPTPVDPTPTPLAPAPPLDDRLPVGRAAARMAYLPAMIPFDDDDACETAVVVQSAGTDPSKAVLITWAADPQACPPQCPGPLKVECSGLLSPGRTWTFVGAQVPTGSTSGVVVSFTARLLSDVGLADELGFDDVVADLMCEELFFGVVGDCDDYRRFMLAYNTGASFRGIPQSRAYGSPISVDVLRTCPNPADANLAGRAGYTGIGGHSLGIADGEGKFRYFLPGVRTGPGAVTLARVQNASTACATAEVWYKGQDKCNEPRRCARLTIGPGFSQTVDLAACAAPGEVDGAAWILGDQPLAVALDAWRGDGLSSYTALPARMADNATGAPLVSAESAVAFAPLVYRDYRGWYTRLHIQNGSSVTEAEVKVYFLDRSGDVITTLVQRICPLGSHVFDLARVAGMPGQWLGSARVESQEWWTPGGTAPVKPPDIHAVAEHVRAAPDTTVSEAMMIPLVGEPMAFDANDGGAGGVAGGVSGGVGLIAIPRLAKMPAATGPTTSLAIQNVVTKPGFTDFAIYIYDQNGLLDFVCQKLQDKQTEYLDLATWGFVNEGFIGSAIISAGFWEHDVFSPSGAHVRNVVGLAAVVVDRPAWSPDIPPMPPMPGHPGVDADRPGDVSTGGIGIPFFVGDGADIGEAPGGMPGIAALCPGWLPPRRTTPTPPPAAMTRPPLDTATPTPVPTFGPSPTPTLVPTPRPTLDPAEELPLPKSPPVHLPTLSQEGQDDVCRPVIAIQNIGGEPSKAAIVFWGAPGFCPPQAAGPLTVECTGLIKSGSTWQVSRDQIPVGAESAVVFSFTARLASEVGINIGTDDIVADLMCEKLFFSVVGDADDYWRFKEAYHRGTVFFDVPQAKAYGAPLAVDVVRHCPADVTPGVDVSAGYRGVTDIGSRNPLFDSYEFHVPLVFRDKAGYTSQIYFQNAGIVCAAIEMWFKAQDDCLRARVCDVSTLAPGESRAFDASDCVGPDWQGSAWIRSSQPLGVTADTVGRDTLRTYNGVPADSTVDADPPLTPATRGSRVAYAPLIYSEYQGWDTGIQVMNLSATVNAKVKVYFYDEGGSIITTLVDWVCPRGSQTFYLPVVHDLPGNWAGSARVVSLDWFTDNGQDGQSGAAIAGVVELTKYSNADRGETLAGASYNLVGEAEGFVWGEYSDGASGVGTGSGGLDSGVGLIAIPLFLRPGASLGGLRTELAVTNLVKRAGYTDYAIVVRDVNGAVDALCQRIHAGQVDYLDLAQWGYLGAGFSGSAFVSATGWHHDVVSATGLYLRNVVGLAAVAVQRSEVDVDFGRTDIRGDEIAISAGVPLGRAAGADLAAVLGDPGCPPDSTAVSAGGWPNPSGPPRVHLPSLATFGSDGAGGAACDAFVAVDNPTNAPSKAVLVAWGAAGACGPDCAGPVAVECTGLLKPGASWQIKAPAGARSGILYSFTGRTTDEIGVTRPTPAIVADILCDALKADLTGSCGGFQAFDAAYRSGGTYAGIPLDKAYGGQLFAEVRRGCAFKLTQTRSTTVWSTYNGATTADAGAPSPVSGRYEYGLPILHLGEFQSQITIQNAGAACADVELWFADRAACAGLSLCRRISLAPGQAQTIATSACLPPDVTPALGFGWVHSSQPAAVVVDSLSDVATTSGLMTYAARPRHRASGDPAAPAGAVQSGGSTALFAPLTYSEMQGWEQTVHIQNLSPDLRAKVKVTFLDRSGDIRTSFVEWICPQGSGAFLFQRLADLAGNWVGSVRVESMPYRLGADGQTVDPPAILGVMEVSERQPTQTGSEIREAAAYELLAEPEAYDWPDGGAGGLGGGTGVIAIPNVRKPAEGPSDPATGAGVNTEIAIANLAEAPGFTDFAMFIFDQNGMTDYVCQKLHDRQVEYIDVASWGYLKPGFTGSVVISAIFWHHPVTEDGIEVANQLGLGAVVVQRVGTRMGEELTGVDELAIAPAIPVDGDLARAIAVTFGRNALCPDAFTPTAEPGGTPTSNPPTAVPPSPVPTDPSPRVTATPFGRPTAFPSTPTPLPTAPPTATPELPPTAEATAVATATPAASVAVAIKVCPGLARRVPASVIADKLAHPETVGGWGQRCNPALPAGPFNGLRTSLGLQNPSRAYQPVYNDVVLRCGCR